MTKTTLDFARRVLPAGPGLYCHCENRPTGWINRPVNSIESLVTLGLSTAPGVNTYFALSSFAFPTASGGGFRTAANAAKQKCLWLDIDAKGRAGEYDTVESALTALVSLMADFPKPEINISGQGLHVYWVMTEAIETSAWRVLAYALKALVADRGLLVDQHRTADAASVLRLPGTVNYGKYGKSYPVVNIQAGDAVPVAHLEALLKFYINEKTRNLATPYTAPNAASPVDSLVASFNTKHDANIVVSECRHVRDCADLSYPQWFYAMQVLSFCENAKEVAHSISRTSPKYDPSHLDKLLTESARRAVASPGYGPVTCEKFAGVEGVDSDGWCASCRHYGKVKTPTSCRVRVTAPPAEVTTKKPLIAALPALVIEEEDPLECFSTELFQVVPGKGIVWNKKDQVEDGDTGETFIRSKELLIADSELYLRRVNEKDDCGRKTRAYVFLKRVPGQGESEIVYNVEDDSGSVRKWLDNNGLTPMPKFKKPMEDFMQTYINKLQNTARMDEVYKNYGWHKMRDKKSGKDVDGFLIGRNMILPDRVKRVPVDPILEQFDEREFTMNGCLTAWKTIPDMYRVLDQKISQLFICAAFAAPFMHLGVSDAKNIMFSLYDPYGGKGKTSLLRVVNSIWGHPGGLFCNSTDTVSARYQLMSARKHLPVCMDEISMIADKEAAMMLYTIASGREKRKSLPGGAGLMNTGDWQTVTFFSSNRSLYEIMESYSSQAAAPNMRVLEFRCDFDPTPEELVMIDERLLMTEHHHGLAGIEFIRSFLQAGPGMKDILLKSAIKLASRFRDGAQERFWAFGLGMSLAAGQLAKAFGLIDYDMSALASWVEDYLGSIRREATRASAGNNAPVILRDFLNAHMDNTLMVRFAERPADMADPSTSDTSGGFGLDPYVMRNPRGHIVVRVEEDTQLCYFSVKPFQDYCRNNNLSWKVLTGELWGKGVLKQVDPVMRSLGNGVRSLGKGRTKCYLADLSRLEG